MKNTQHTPQIEVNVIEIGGSLYISLPKTVKNHLNASKGDQISMQTEYTEDHGEYVSFWNKKQQL